MPNKKVLVTGMTAQHHSLNAATRSSAFSIALKDVLSAAGYEVHFVSPSTETTAFNLSKYTHVFVGIAPPMSIAANTVYGALCLIDEMWDSQKMTMFVDAPEPWKIFGSLRSIERTPDSLFKSFFSRRPEYRTVSQSKKNKNKVLSGIEKLNHKNWPTTIYPALPWKTNLTGIHDNAMPSFTPLSADSFCISSSIKYPHHRAKSWVLDSPSTKWSKEVTAGLVFGSVHLKETRVRSSDDVEKIMSENLGVLLGPSDDKIVWWSAKFAQALNTLTPVATDWKVSQQIGQSWGHLAASIEAMDEISRYELAAVQRNEYINAIATREETIEQLKKVAGI